MKDSARLSVGFLTLARPRGRNADNMLALAASVAVAATCAVLLSPAAVAADDWQPVGDIEATAERFVDGNLGQAAARSQTRATPLDPRLRLNRCEKPLEASMRSAARSSRQSVVAVTCSGAKPWKVYVPVDITSTEPVLVMRRTRPRGHRLEAADVVREDRDVSRMSGGYLTTVGELTGQRLKRTLAAGTIVTPSSLAAQTLVHRGQSVTLTVASGDLDIRMAGKALMDGVLNERIRVENLSSQRIVEGLVRSPQTVEVMVW